MVGLITFEIVNYKSGEVARLLARDKQRGGFFLIFSFFFFSFSFLL